MSRLDCSISGSLERVRACGRRELWPTASARAPSGGPGAVRCPAPPVLERGEGQRQGIESGRRRRQAPELSTRGREEGAEGVRPRGSRRTRALGFRGRPADRGDGGTERHSGEGPGADAGRGQALTAPGGDARQGVPAPGRGSARQARAVGPPPAARRQIGLAPGCIAGTPAAQSTPGQEARPAAPAARGSGPCLCNGEQAFLTRIPARRTTSRLAQALVPRNHRRDRPSAPGRGRSRRPSRSNRSHPTRPQASGGGLQAGGPPPPRRPFESECPQKGTRMDAMTGSRRTAAGAPPRASRRGPGVMAGTAAKLPPGALEPEGGEASGGWPGIKPVRARRDSPQSPGGLGQPLLACLGGRRGGHPLPCPSRRRGSPQGQWGAGAPPPARRGNGAGPLRGGLAPAGALAGGASGAPSRRERPGAQAAPLAPATEGARPGRCCRPLLAVAAPGGKVPGPLPVADREDGGGLHAGGGEIR